jgi:hypothetical protein
MQGKLFAEQCIPIKRHQMEGGFIRSDSDFVQIGGLTLVS